MTNNITANSFHDLSLFGKLQRIAVEPGKASNELRYKLLSIIGQNLYTPFLILTRDRTGSNMLVQYLNTHPNVRCDYELLSRLKRRTGPSIVETAYGKQPFYIKAKGFKVFYYHPMDEDTLSVESTWNVLRSVPNLKLIHLRRRNILETAISSKLAYETGLYGELANKIKLNLSSSSTLSDFSITFPSDKLEAVFKQTRQWESQWPQRFSDAPQYEIFYEDLVSDPKSQLLDVFKFLGVELSSSLQLSTTFRKQRRKKMRQVLANYDALKMHFASTQWAEFFVE